MKLVDNIFATIFLTRNGFFDGSLVEIDVELERPLIGGLHTCQIQSDEVKIRDSFGNILVEVADNLELRLEILQFLHLLRNFLRLLLGTLQSLNQIFIVEEVTSGITQQMQDLILSNSLLILVIKELLDITLFLLFLHWLLHLHHDVEHLVIQTLQGHLEV